MKPEARSSESVTGFVGGWDFVYPSGGSAAVSVAS